MKRGTIKGVFVEFIPESLDEGVLYISRRFKTAVHLCACGCRGEVVTPLSPAEWWLSETKGRVSLWPSIGNWSLPCQSHYWVQEDQVVWDRAMSHAQIERVRSRDRADKAEHIANVNATKARSLEPIQSSTAAISAPSETVLAYALRTLQRLIGR